MTNDTTKPVDPEPVAELEDRIWFNEQLRSGF